jgi:HAD superfamily hydrolase (TIGR01548 family)
MSELFIKQELLKTLPQLDAILLDVDGVILDVSESYRVVIAETAQWYAREVLKLEDNAPLLEGRDIEGFKLAGGFNSDWDLTSAVVMLIIAKWVRSGARDTSTLAAYEPSWSSFTSEIKRRGGGLPMAEMAVLEMLTPGQRRDFANAYHPRLVVQVFQEMYGGDEACKTLYGFDPEHIHGEGFYKKEKVLIDADLLSSLSSHYKIGLLTGRTKNETQLAMDFSGLRIPETNWVTEDDGVKKPDGQALLLLQEKLSFKFGVYIGDTLDDLNVVKNYRETKGAGRAKIVACTALSGPSGDAHRRLFLEAGTEIASPDANTFLQYLKAITK